MPRYVVKATRFHCVDESGFDFFGSDEPCWVFTANAAGKVTTAISPEFSNVDSGDTRSFEAADDRNTVWPKAGDKAGAPGPIALSVQLWEIDQGSAANVRKKTELALSAAKLLPLGEWVSHVPQVVRDQLVDFISDDLMGSRTLYWSEHRLAKLLPTVGSSHRARYRLGGRAGDLPFEIAGGPDYDLYLRITRVA